MRGIPTVESIDHECQLMGSCNCGGDWMLAYNEVAPRADTWVDHITVRCAECGLRHVFEFDISKFFLPRPGIWTRARTARTSQVVRLGHVQQARATSSMGFGAVA